jgi:hypothetical protein
VVVKQKGGLLFSWRKWEAAYVITPPFPRDAFFSLSRPASSFNTTESYLL